MPAWDKNDLTDYQPITAFKESCCDGGAQAANANSAYSCGCDMGCKSWGEPMPWFCAHYPDCVYGQAEQRTQDQQNRVTGHLTGGTSSVRLTPLPRAVTNKFGPVKEALEGLTRKQYPVATGVLDYFPDALMAIAYVSWLGNQQHNPGQPLHWDRTKSTDDADAMLRHFKDRGKFDTDGARHSAKAAWRTLALLQKEIEQSS